MLELGVNIDHVATLRQARRGHEPDPVWAAALAELGGADCITVHLREDRRHIQDRDLEILRRTVAVKLNMELACAREIVDIACRVKPDQATLVPERREEITTEGGLDVTGNYASIARVVDQLHTHDIAVSMFIDPDAHQIEACHKLGVAAIELHTGCYAQAKPGPQREEQLINVQSVAAIPDMRELNIGHAIMSRAIMVGMERAVREMKEEMRQT
jgi:pyridoxine 5-phosphate synthase